RPNATVTLAEWLAAHEGDLTKILGEKAVRILQDDDLVVWDTENDGVGGTHILELTREWGFRRLKTGEKLHLYRGDANIEQRIIDFVGNRQLVAFEPSGCDRNRMKHLPLAYDTFRNQFIDFRRDIFNRMFSTDYQEDSKFYLADGMQDTIWRMSGVVGMDNFLKEKIGLIEVSRPAKDGSNKCQMDISALTNLCLLLKYFI
ncbi:hypothetical protein HK100_005870, partial [Physocladia obscura]